MARNYGHITRAKTQFEQDRDTRKAWNLVTLCLFLCTGLTGIFIWVLG